MAWWIWKLKRRSISIGHHLFDSNVVDLHRFAMVWDSLNKTTKIDHSLQPQRNGPNSVASLKCPAMGKWPAASHVGFQRGGGEKAHRNRFVTRFGDGSLWTWSSNTYVVIPQFMAIWLWKSDDGFLMDIMSKSILLGKIWKCQSSIMMDLCQNLRLTNLLLSRSWKTGQVFQKKAVGFWCWILRQAMVGENCQNPQDEIHS